MPAKIRCPHCRTSLSLKEATPGRKVRCPECERAFAVPDDEGDPPDDRLRRGDDPPARRPAAARRDEDDRPRRREDDDRPRRRRDADETPSGGLPVLLIVGAVVGGLLLLVGVGAAAIMMLGVRGGGGGPVVPAPMAAAPAPAGAMAPAPAPAPGGAAPPAPAAAAAGPTLRYRWQGAPAVYAVNVALENDKEYELHRGYTTVTARPGARPAGPAAERKGTGTGFVVHADGYLITCAHVVEDATKIEVAIGGKAFPGTVKAVDHVQDLALIHIPTNGLPTVPLGDSEVAELGTEVWAVGFPLSSVLGDNIKITKGTLSGINKRDGHKVFQVDAAINPGNSGGPLFTANGGVLGVNKAKLAGEAVSNIGFATPVNEVARMLRGQNVAFSGIAAGGEKLEGPALIRRVGQAVALITVTAGPSAADPLTISFTTSLSRATRAKGAGAPEAGLPPPAGGGTRGEIDADARGEIANSPRNDVRLPALLGGVGRFLLEPLPSGGQPTWEKTAGWVIQQADDGPGGGFPGRLRPPGMRMPGGKFGPAGGGVVRKQLAIERSVYTRQGVNGDLVTIEKRFGLKADQTKDMSGFTFDGTKVIVFDAKAGLPRSMEFKGELVEKEDNRTLRLPMTVSYKLVEGEDRDKVLNAKAPAPVKPAPPAPEAGPLTDDQLKAVLAEVAAGDPFKWRAAVDRLKQAKPEEARKAEVAKVLAKVAGDEKADGFLRRACVELLGDWGTADSVPTLLPLVESSDAFMPAVAIVAVGKLKDERAAEPVAKRLGELRYRNAASAALKAIGSKAEKAVAAQLTHADQFTRAEAARILKEIGTAASKAALQKAATDKSPSAARAAREALDAIAKR